MNINYIVAELRRDAYTQNVVPVCIRACKCKLIIINKNYSLPKKYETKIDGKFEAVIHRKCNTLESNLDTVIYNVEYQ